VICDQVMVVGGSDYLSVVLGHPSEFKECIAGYIPHEYYDLWVDQFDLAFQPVFAIGDFVSMGFAIIGGAAF
jgi:hypothetical protein